MVTICGFAYGMKGFAIAAPASSIGSAIVFLGFRRFCTKRLRQWAARNKNWQALEAVIVCISFWLLCIQSESHLTASQRLTFDHPYSYVTRTNLDMEQHSIRSSWSLFFSFNAHFIFFIDILQSVEAVEFWQFVIATFFVYPKLLLYTFIGSQAAALSDGKQRKEMETRK